MLSSVLRSKKAAQANVVIMRTYVKLRQMLATNADLAHKVEQLDRKVAILYNSFEKLMHPDPPKKTPDRLYHTRRRGLIFGLPQIRNQALNAPTDAI